MANRISNIEEEIFETMKNQLGVKIENDFYNFLNNFELTPEDPNF